MKLKYFLFFCLSFLILNSSFLTGTVRYVSKTGTSTPPYTSWQTAADSIQKCINICVDGDTIYVANGVYKEQIIMTPGLSLIGSGMDSCVIDTRQLVTSQDFRSVQVADSCLLTGFHIIVYNNSSWGRGIVATQENLKSWIYNNRVSNGFNGFYENNLNSNNRTTICIYKNIFSNVAIGVYIFNSNALVRNNFISIPDISEAKGVSIGAFDNNYYPIIDSNYIEMTSALSEGIRKSFGTNPTIRNNAIMLKHVGASGIRLSTSDSAEVYNNSIYAEEGYNGIENSATQYLKLFNNYLTGNFNNRVLHIGPDNIVENNVVANANLGVNAWGAVNLTFQYNNAWNNIVNYSGFTPDSTNISVDPMIVNDDTTQGELDFHLQKYSPLIDAGDPNILDRDGSRSDLGLYGGPYGWTYTYNDLAPRPPHNVTVINEDGLIKLTWNKNTEADFSHYKIYRDTVSILIYDSTRVVGVTSDTVFYDNLPPSNTEKRYYYLITAFDNQGNQSAPSEEINVTITGLSEHPPIGFDSYALLSNYPNPFNPSTIIPYRLKEGGYVKLYIYDMKGELVKTLVNQWQSSGYYEVVFHPSLEERKKASSLEVPMGKTYSDMSSGVYLYQILVRSDGDIPVFSDMGKMILLK